MQSTAQRCRWSTRLTVEMGAPATRGRRRGDFAGGGEARGVEE